MALKGIRHQDLKARIAKGEILPVYLLVGDEEFLVQEAVDLIIEKVVDPASRDFTFTSLSCRDTSADEIVNLAQTYPFMAERRLVVARDVDQLKAADLEALAAYLRAPLATTCLVMTAKRGFEKKAVTAPAAERGAIAVFYPLREEEVPGWIETRVRARNLTIGRDASQQLFETVGNDLQKIANELEKVFIAVKDRKEVTLADVTAAVGDFREFTSFELADALGARDRERSFMVLNRLLQEGESPVGLLGAVAWNFRRLLRAKSLEAAGTGYEEIKTRLRVIFHQSAAFQRQMRSWSVRELEAAFGTLLAADRGIKSGGLAPRLVLERMVLTLCGTK
jgi:DNA polymerase-3 subunit delta